MSKAKRTPIMEFKTQEEAEKSLAEWQKRLFLQDWIIMVNICEPKDLASGDRYGECVSVYTKNDAVVRILDKEYFPSDAVEKYCAEHVLVHELLHCKYIGMEVGNPNIEQCFYNTMQHSLLEQMAKSLIMAKYNLPFSWFKNF